LNRTRWIGVARPSRQPIFLPSDRLRGTYEIGSSTTRYWSTTGFVRRDVGGPGSGLLGLVLLAACAPFIARGRAQPTAALLLATGVILLLVPVASLLYDGRYTLPAYAPLAGRAAIALQALVNRVRRRAAADQQAPAPRPAA
jgi:hypothetical protein